MALRDQLKHFSDYDGYSGDLTKKDMDDNLNLLADNIDAQPFESTADKIRPKDSEIGKGLIIGTQSFAWASGEEWKAYFDNSNNNVYIGRMSGDITFSGHNNFAFGDNNKINGEYSLSIGSNDIYGYQNSALGNGNEVYGDENFVFGNGNEVGYDSNDSNHSVVFGKWLGNYADWSFVFGYQVNNNQNNCFVIGFPDSSSNACSQNITFVDALYTYDNNTKYFENDIDISYGVYYIILKGVVTNYNFQQKWIFERKLIVVGNETYTIESDNNTDIIKDNSNWEFDVEISGDKLKLKATGESNVEIIWGLSAEIRIAC